MQVYSLPPAVVHFDSAAVERASRRAFGRGVFRSAAYEPTPEERLQYIEMMEGESRFIGTQVDLASASGLYPRCFDDLV